MPLKIGFIHTNQVDICILMHQKFANMGESACFYGGVVLWGGWISEGKAGVIFAEIMGICLLRII